MECEFLDCGKDIVTKFSAYCSGHQTQWYKSKKDNSKLTPLRNRIKNTQIGSGFKICRICLENKPDGQFHVRSSSPDGLALYCKPCEKNKKLRNMYGIEINKVLEKLQNQNGLCTICNEDITDCWVVDHCHDTLKIRDLLCSPCNLMLGMSKDDSTILDRAANYIRRWA